MKYINNGFLKIKIILSKRINFSISKYFYLSYYHLLLNSYEEKINPNNYITTFPNRSAGFGHQLTDVISAFSISKEFGLSFCFTKFNSPEWNSFLQLNNFLKNYYNLSGYKEVKLPRFDFDNLHQRSIIRKIISSYNNRKVIFKLEIDQFYVNQPKYLDTKLLNYVRSKTKNYLNLNNSEYIAIHVRRGDILKNTRLKKLRFIPIKYYTSVLDNLLKIEDNRKKNIYIFSNSDEKYINDNFIKYNNIHVMNKKSEIESFALMLNSDILVFSKSSFSYNAAILSTNKKICPPGFWHSYSDSPNYILADAHGNF